VSIDLGLAVIGGLTGGIVARMLRVPGGALLGAVLGAAAVQLALGGDESLPAGVRIAVQITIGLVVGSNLRFEAFRGMGRILARTPALLALLFTIAAAIGVGFATLIGATVPVGVLSTIPGGASDMIAIALEIGEGAPIVAAVHLVRLLIIYVVLSSLFRRLLPPAAPTVPPPGA